MQRGVQFLARRERQVLQAHGIERREGTSVKTRSTPSKLKLRVSKRPVSISFCEWPYISAKSSAVPYFSPAAASSSWSEYSGAPLNWMDLGNKRLR